MNVDTIASVSTAPGLGAIAVVRVSGSEADRVLRALVPGLDRMPEPRRATLVQLTDPADGSPLDRAVVTRFEGPASYTGEDLVELSCHGGWLVPDLVLDACVRAGARRAEAGELTRRAYLRGKLDLVQAEAIADLIGARSRAQHRAALAQVERGLSDRIGALRARLVGVEALLAHHIDFPEEDEPPVPIARVVEETSLLVGQIDAMLATAPEGALLREGALTVLAGRPNAGKSSLYNALLGEERAIVTEEPGTTRDALEAAVELGGFPFRLVDTAGLRDSEGRIERLGIEVAMRYLERADLIVLCIPADEGPSTADTTFLAGVAATPVVVVETKGDLLDGGRASPGGNGTPSAAGEGGKPGSGSGSRAVAGRVTVSARTGEGLDRLRELLPRLVYSAVVTAGAETPVVTRRRHARALACARDEIEAMRTGLLDGLPPEIASTHLRPAETALEELLGVVSIDDVLDVVFREFCVGK